MKKSFNRASFLLFLKGERGSVLTRKKVFCLSTAGKAGKMF